MKLKNNITVTGIVKSLDHKNTFNYFNEKLNIKGNNVLFDVDNLANYNKSYMKNSKYNGFLYHIITDEKYFFLKDTKVFDYNACLEYFLNN